MAPFLPPMLPFPSYSPLSLSLCPLPSVEVVAMAWARQRRRTATGRRGSSSATSLSARDVAGRPAGQHTFSFEASDYPTRQEVSRQVTDRGGGTSHFGGRSNH